MVFKFIDISFEFLIYEYILSYIIGFSYILSVYKLLAQTLFILHVNLLFSSTSFKIYFILVRGSCIPSLNDSKYFP